MRLLNSVFAIGCLHAYPCCRFHPKRLAQLGLPLASSKCLKGDKLPLNGTTSMQNLLFLILILLPPLFLLLLATGDGLMEDTNMCILSRPVLCYVIWQAMEHTGRCVAVSEPNSLYLLATKYPTFGDSPQTRQLARDIIRWECRPYPTMQPPPLGYFLKLMSHCFVLLPMLRQRRRSVIINFSFQLGSKLLFDYDS